MDVCGFNKCVARFDVFCCFVYFPLHAATRILQPRARARNEKANNNALCRLHIITLRPTTKTQHTAEFECGVCGKQHAANDDEHDDTWKTHRVSHQLISGPARKQNQNKNTFYLRDLYTYAPSVKFGYILNGVRNWNL